MEDGGWREGMRRRDGGLTCIQDGWHRTRCWLKRALVYIFARAHSNSRFGFPFTILLFFRQFQIGRFVDIYFSIFPDAELRLVQCALYLNVALRWPRVSRLSFPLTNPF